MCALVRTPVDFGGLSAAVMETVRSRIGQQMCARRGLIAEGEGFEPSTDRNGR
jgi:hypothetical protein